MVIGVFRHHVVWVLLLFAASASAAAAQGGSDSERQSSEPQSGEKVPTQPERRTVGTVAALGRGSIAIRTEQDRFIVYELTQRTVRTKVVEPGARVSILTLSSDTAPAPRALAITVLPVAQGLAEPAESAEIEPNVPQQVQQLTTQIERQARRFRAGLTGGVAIDPELISLDAFATFGPFFTRNLSFRPNLEFAFGSRRSSVSTSMRSTRCPVCRVRSGGRLTSGLGRASLSVTAASKKSMSTTIPMR